MAWRSYTKHSKNKVQEIQGAVLPIRERYSLDQPFLGAILAGKFTAPSIAQLRSLDFHVVYVAYESIVEAFARFGIDVRFDETTTEAWFAEAFEKIEAQPEVVANVLAWLSSAYATDLNVFFDTLKGRLARTVAKVLVAPLYGSENGFASITEAVKFIEGCRPADGSGPLRGFDVVVRYNNGDHIDGRFADSSEAAKFLRYFAQ